MNRFAWGVIWRVLWLVVLAGGMVYTYLTNPFMPYLVVLDCF